MATTSTQNSVTRDQQSRDDLKGYVIFIYVLAGLQSVVPLLLGSPITAVLGPIIGILGYLISRRYIWAAVLLAIIGTLNALVLALGKAIGGTFLTMFMVASCIKCIGIIKRSRGELPAAPDQPVSETRVVPEAKQVEDSIQASESPASEGGFSLNTFARRLLLVFGAIAAMAIVIALGASSRQGGFLGAAIILVFWGMAKKKPQEAGPPDVQ
jgi:hypothetical protein